MQWAGIDLAWGRVNTSAAVMLEIRDGQLVVTHHANALTNDESVCAWLANCEKGDGLYVGVDAPLVVRNYTGERSCESMMRRCFGHFEAGPLPANRTLFNDYVRGEQLIKMFNEMGITFGGDHGPRAQHVRSCYEVFPHAAHIGLFEINKTLKYKAGKGRSRESRMTAYAELVENITELSLDEYSLAPPPWLQVPYCLRGAELKRFEDLVDALICAFTVAYLWQWGTEERCRIIGDACGEHIVAPVTKSIAECLDQLR